MVPFYFLIFHCFIPFFLPSYHRKSRKNITADDSGDGAGTEREKTNLTSKGQGVKDGEGQKGEGQNGGEPISQLYERDLVRMMAEVNFINGEVRGTTFLKNN